MTLKRILLTTVAAGALATAGSPVDVAASAPGVRAIETLCQLRGGIAFTAPDAHARCQAADPQFGFRVEELICTHVLAGTFTAVPTFMRPNRTTWSCA